MFPIFQRRGPWGKKLIVKLSGSPNLSQLTYRWNDISSKRSVKWRFTSNANITDRGFKAVFSEGKVYY